MSIHVPISPEAQSRLNSQRRNSTISSILIALLLTALIGVILYIISITLAVQEVPTIVTYQGNQDNEEELEIKKVTNTVQRKPAAPSSSMAKVIAANSATPTAIPVPDIDIPVPSTDFGDGDSFGDGWGSGAGAAAGGSGFGNIPASMRKRCTKADRLARLKETGGTPQCEDTVMASLRWMQTTQKGDGSWTGRGKGGGYPSGMTGLALLAYLGHCETPLSQEFGDTVLAATTYLVDLGMKNNGKLTTDFLKHWAYEHAISAYALCECYTFSKQFKYDVPNLEQATRDSIQWILDNQNEAGAWNYQYESGSRNDTSVNAWHLQALKAAQATGLKFRGIKRVIDRGLEALEKNYDSKEGTYGYTSKNYLENKGHFTLTGAGALCMQQHKGASNASARRSVKWIDEVEPAHFGQHKPVTNDSNLYEHYYSSQTMMNNGGKPWDNYNERFREPLLKAFGGGGSIGNNHYHTCLGTLMLEVYYRFLPGTGKVKN